MPIFDALNRLILEFDETTSAAGDVRAHGLMSFGKALEGPPGRLHGGHHALVRTLPILERITRHEHARTFPCTLDVSVQQSLPLEETVPFEATYRAEGDSWELTTRLQGSDRLLASASSIPDEPLLDRSELLRLKTLYEESRPPLRQFGIFGMKVHVAEKIVWMETHDPKRTLPESQHAALVDATGSLGPAFFVTQLDLIGASARAACVRHPHFTKHIELSFAVPSVPASAHLLCIGDRTTIEDDATSASAAVEIKGERYGTAHVRVALVDASFERAYATGSVTVHPVDPAKFAGIKEMRGLRKDLE